MTASRPVRGRCESSIGESSRTVTPIDTTIPTVGTLVPLALVAALSTWGDSAKEIARLAKLAPREQCAGLEKLLGEPGIDEDSRRTALTRIRDLAESAAPPLSDAEREIVEQLEKRSSPVVEPLRSRYAIVLGNETFVRNARVGQVSGLLDAIYVVQRQLFAVDPVRDVGRRFVFFPEKTKPYGWTIQPANLTVAYGRASVDQGGFDDLMAHELSHAFTWRHPARHWFFNGFAEGWSDLAIAHAGERLGFLGGPLEKVWPNWRDGILAAGKTEYLDTRLPIEESVAYGPSISVVLRLVLDSAATGTTSMWAPLEDYFASHLTVPAVNYPAYLSPARFARDLEAIFPPETTRDVLSQWRFPLDAGVRREIDTWTRRAKQDPPLSRAERWKADGETPILAWRVLGPIHPPEGRVVTPEFDPIDAWNFTERDEYGYAGKKYGWRADVRADADGVVHLGDLPESNAPSLFHLRADLPPDVVGPITLSIGSDDDCLVWIDGQLVHAFRGDRGTYPDDPDRAYALVEKGGGRLLIAVVNRGGPAGFHLRYARGTPFETSLRTEARAPDARRRLMAVHRFGTMRVPYALVAALYDTALGDASAEVRSEAARLLGGRRGEFGAIDELLAAWTREKEPSVSAAIRRALSEMTFLDFADSSAAHRWWRDGSKAWRETRHVEAESAYVLGSVFGGFYGNNAGSYGGQHVGRCFGGDSAHALSLVLDIEKTGTHSLFVRYASADGDRRADVRVRRGELPVAARTGAVFEKTETWVAWRWQEIPLGVLPAGRLRVEIGNVDGCLDLDVLGFRPSRD